MKRQMNLFIYGAAAFGMAAIFGAADATVHARQTVAHGGIGGTVGATVISVPRETTHTAPGMHIQNNINITQTRPAPATVVQSGAPLFYTPGQVRPPAVSAWNFTGGPECGALPAPAPMVMHHAPQQEWFPPAAPVQQPMQTQRAERARRAQNEMKVLAHPFFMPAAGRFAAISDIGWHRTTFDFVVPEINPALATTQLSDWQDGEAGGWRSSQLFFKQDLVYGISDTFAIRGNVKYAIRNDARMSWDRFDPSTARSSGFDQLGIGLQWRAFEDADSIAQIGLTYQWTEWTNALALDGRIGRKMGQSTLYARAALWGISWRNDAYGAYMPSAGGDQYYIVFNDDAALTFVVEGAVGIFSALTRNWSVGGEFIVGHYDWHNQAAIAGTLNFQPVENFAIGLYARMSIWDDANGTGTARMWASSPGAPPAGSGGILVPVGSTNLSNYRDIMFGVRGIVYF